MLNENKTEIYHYHPETGEYLGKTTARLDPIDRKPLIPANATVIPATLPTKKNEVQVFNGKNWVIKADFRNEVFYKSDGTQVEIRKIGEIPSKNLYKKKPAPNQPSKSVILAGIKAEAARRIEDSGHDWMVIRQITTNKKIPQHIVNYAKAVRQASNKLEKKLPIDFSNDKYWPERL